jgi:hypothetical protein
MSERDDRPMGVPGAAQPVDPERLLADVQAALDHLDQLETADQVAVYDRAHATLAEALARTADTGGPPIPGQSGA